MNQFNPFFFAQIIRPARSDQEGSKLHQRESCPSKPPESHVEDRGAVAFQANPLAIAGPAMGCHTSPLSSKSQVLLVGVNDPGRWSEDEKRVTVCDNCCSERALEFRGLFLGIRYLL